MKAPALPPTSADVDEEPPYHLDDQIGFVLRLAVQYHTAIFTAHMVENLTQTQFATLAKLYEVRRCSQSDLVRLLTLDSATVNGVVERMRARGFITHTDDPNDRRRQWLALTDEGVRAIRAAQDVAEEITEETLTALTPSERARLVHLLRKMMDIPPRTARGIRAAAASRRRRPPPPIR